MAGLSEHDSSKSRESFGMQMQYRYLTSNADSLKSRIDHYTLFVSHN
jgi:hypothetical protein